MPRLTIVEDDYAIAQLLKVRFSALGFEIEHCEDGAEAVETIRQSQPDAVILDVNLPHKNGFEIAKELRADAALATVPILMLTAQSDIDSRLKGLAHADDYLAKPFSLQELEARLKALLRRSSMQQPQMPHVANLEGTQIRHYVIEHMLGQGATAIVYKGRDSLLRRDVVLKFFTEVAFKPQFKERFFREARVMSRIKHPHITEVYSVEELDSGHVFMVMPYLEGQTLEALLQHRRSTVEECLTWSRQLLSGLVKAHQQGVIHRDIKPENIFISQNGEAKILDFGVAKLKDINDPDRAKLTQDGTLIGTINYMSPEQLRGQELDETADCWGLAAVMYEMLSGQRPFRAQENDIFSIFNALMHVIPESLTSFRQDVPLALEASIFKALAKNKDERFASSQLMLEALERIDLRLP